VAAALRFDYPCAATTAEWRSACASCLLVHPGPLFYSEVYLRLEPLGMEYVEYVAQALERAGHDVCLIDLQVFNQRELDGAIKTFQP
jgi:hopanoid C-3 methylase